MGTHERPVLSRFREQKMRMEVGKSYIVHIHIDEESYRIVASAKVERYLDNTRHPDLKAGEKVQLLVWQKSPIGFKVIVNNRYAGLVYDGQVFRLVHHGDRCDGYVSNIRPDGKLDITLQPTGREQTLSFADTLLEYLHTHGGVCPFGDKSEAEDIKHTFHVSKKRVQTCCRRPLQTPSHHGQRPAHCACGRTGAIKL